MSLPRRLAARACAALGFGAVVTLLATVGVQGTAATTGPSLAVNGLDGYTPANSNLVHTIPEAIYGINWASPHLRSVLKVPLNRWGGNETSLYDYKTNAFNNGNDWYFENQIGNDTNHQVAAWVSSNKSTGTPSLVTVPMMGWVANANKPQACGFSIKKYGSQQSNDSQWRPDCGNGVRTNGQRITGNDPTDIATQVTPATQAGAMVGVLKSQGVHLYELDNEPGLWHDTHRAVHPQPLTHTEWWNKARPTAEAIKSADSSAKIVGPSDAGYCWWLYDAADNCGPGANHAATGDLAAWYVKQFKAYADAHSGKRLLDYLDEHYYPESPNGSPGIALAPSGDAATQARRLRSTRSLWDPNYVDESWIGTDVGAKPLRFIRQLREWAALYPGTKTAITEYNWGGFDTINGALAQADVLGIFGREGLDLATLWNYDNSIDGTWGEWAFRVYRNFDGNGARFGQWGVPAASSDQGLLSVYASKGTSALTVVVINKTKGALTSYLKLYNFPHTSAARTFTLGPTKRAITETSTAVGKYGLSRTYPAQSVTLLLIKHS